MGSRLRALILTLSLCLLLAVAASSSARADEGSRLYNFWGNTATQFSVDRGGEFSEAGGMGVAVNDASGDVYVADAGNNRIQQFDSAGNFIRAWGFDVIRAGRPGDLGTNVFETCTAVPAAANPGENCKAGIESVAPAPGGELKAPQGLAIDQDTGNVYVVDKGFLRVQEFTATGGFIRAWGQNVVQGGQPEDRPAAPAQETLSVDAAAGSFTLSFQGQSSGDIAFDASAVTVQAALEGLSSVGAGNVAVSGGPGAAGGGTPYTIVFAGALTNSPQPLIVAAPGSVPLSGGGATATVAYATAGPVASSGYTGFEVCTVAARCQAGSAGTTAGALRGSPGYLAVAPAGAPNAGNVLIANGGVQVPAGNKRIDEFTATGEFVRAFGGDVVAAGPGNTGTTIFEVCRAATFDVCKAGIAGTAPGFFSANATRVTEDRFGNIYTIEATNNFRVQKFTLPGNVVTPQGSFDPAELGGAINGPFEAKDNSSEIAVDSAGYVYVVKAFPRGTGTPPADVRLGTTKAWQSRVLKVDSATERVVDTFLVNAGPLGPQNVEIQSVVGLGVKSTGRPIYVTTGGVGSGVGARVHRIDAVPGLTATLETPTDVGASSATLNATITPATIPLGTLYRFEYLTEAEYVANGNSFSGANRPVAVPSADFDLGNGSAGGSSGSCAAGGVEAAVCKVSRRVVGLVPGTAYKVRLVAHTVYNGAVTAEVQDLHTPLESAPLVATGGARWSSPAGTDPTLTMAGIVNPSGVRATYYFQYVDGPTYQADLAGGDGFQHAERTPVAAAEAGRGLGDVAVWQVAFGLDPSVPYEYRLVADGGNGEAHGKGRLVAPPDANGRFYERVSDGDSWGTGVSAAVAQIADSGDRAQFSGQAFGQPVSLPGVSSPFVSSRGAGGWEVSSMLSDPSHSYHELKNDPSTAADLGSNAWLESSRAESERSEARFGIVHLDGSRGPSLPLVPLEASPGGGLFNARGSAADLSSVVFQFAGASGVRLQPDESRLAANQSNLYQASSAGALGPRLSIVNREDGANGALIGGGCGAGLGASASFGSADIASHAVSADGSVVYFSARPGEAAGSCTQASPKRLYRRTDSAQTVEVSTPQCVPGPCAGPGGDDRFEGASVDGSVAFLRTARRLTNSDGDSGQDLYAYDLKAHNEVQKLIVAASAGTFKLGFGADQTPDLGFAASAADVQGALNALPSIGAGGTEVTAGGAGSYLVEFKGGSLAGEPQQALTLASSLTGSARIEPLVTGGHLTQVSLGEAVISHPTVGSGAAVLGVLDSSADGSRVYFVAEGVLSGPNLLSQSPSAGDPNLYVYDRDGANPHGRISFVAVLAPGAEGDQGEWRFGFNEEGKKRSTALPAQGTEGDGHLLLFLSRARLLPGIDSDEAIDVYRYDDSAGPADALRCLSCSGNGNADVVTVGRPVGSSPGNIAQISRAASEDASTVVFATEESLVAEDANSTWDAYEWHDGVVSLVSGGTEGFGVPGELGNIESAAPTVSRDGRNIFFVTRAPLDPGDDNNAIDLYDARSGGGFPATRAIAVCSDEEGCHGGPPVAPVAPRPGSSHFEGEGNLPKPPACKKKQVRRHGRCVKKPTRPKKRKHGHTGRHHGGAK